MEFLIMSPLIKIYFFSIALLIFTSCSNKQTSLVQQLPEQKMLSSERKHTMIVLVHGTLLPLPISPAKWFTSMKNFFTKKEYDDKSMYHAYLDQLRFAAPYNYQPIGPRGLHAIDTNATSKQKKLFSSYTYPIIQNIDHVWHTTIGHNNQNHWYTFGWYGRLDHKDRIQAAEELYQQLLREKESLAKKYELSPNAISLIVVGHSHGGNVLLNLVKAEEKYKKQLHISRLVLIATPIQKQTAYLAKHPMFDRVLSCYSRSDDMQVMDIVSSSNWKSKRQFNFTHPHLVQMEVQIGDLWPNHAEWWLWNAPNNILYRSKLAISPVPFVVLLPIALDMLNKNPNICGKVYMKIESDKAQHNISFTQETDAKHLLNCVSIKRF